ncbi:hypothetical protein E4U55_005077 [Claviceps digitariae]|nr:hypothetical protein E4U55_005077 [Claviceps digitariae]
MKSHSLFSLLSFLALKASVSALSVPEATTKLWIPSWDMLVQPGSDETIVVNGTIQQAHAYMEKSYPGWADRWAQLSSHDSSPHDDNQAVAKRADALDYMRVKRVMCNQPRRRCMTSAIRAGIEYLKGISKRQHPRNGPGPRACGKVSCSEDAAIIWCNDTDDDKTLNSFGDIAFGAEVVVHSCAIGGVLKKVSGQAFLFGDYTVIVGTWDCNTDHVAEHND